MGLLISIQPSRGRPGGIHWLAYGFRDKRLTAYLFMYFGLRDQFCSCKPTLLWIRRQVLSNVPRASLQCIRYTDLHATSLAIPIYEREGIVCLCTISFSKIQDAELMIYQMIAGYGSKLQLRLLEFGHAIECKRILSGSNTLDRPARNCTTSACY